MIRFLFCYIVYLFCCLLTISFANCSKYSVVILYVIVLNHRDCLTAAQLGLLSGNWFCYSYFCSTLNICNHIQSYTHTIYTLISNFTFILLLILCLFHTLPIYIINYALLTIIYQKIIIIIAINKSFLKELEIIELSNRMFLIELQLRFSHA